MKKNEREKSGIKTKGENIQSHHRVEATAKIKVGTRKNKEVDARSKGMTA